MKTIFKISSENCAVSNYIEYDPNNTVWASPIRGANRKRKLGIKSKQKNETSYKRRPEGVRIVEVIIPKGQKKATLATTMRVDDDFYLCLDFKIVPELWTPNGKAVGFKIVATDGGIYKAKDRDKDNTIAYTGEDGDNYNYMLLKANPLSAKEEEYGR